MKKISGMTKKAWRLLSGDKGTEVRWQGDYNSWEEALAACGNEGYAEDNILERTLQSTLKVKNGEAVFERDSVLFDRIEYSFPLLACLLKIAAAQDNTLSVVDYGGALGSHYFQNRTFLQPVTIRQWVVVEQEKHVKAGNRFISEGPLRFEQRLEDISGANVLLSSCMLPYVERPYEYACKFADSGIEYILLDRIPISAENRDRLTVEIVPPQIYAARYPSWFLCESKLLAVFQEKYELVVDFVSPIDHANIPSVYKGFLFMKKK